ncbi:MAG: MFS transporter [Christensenellales bacterium]|nr:MFS transporter [Christensenellales bacterium]
MEKTVQTPAAKSTPLGKKIWACAIVFGLIGQIAWVVENMFFAKFGQDLFDTRGNLYFTVTTLMVILSAVTATVTTIFAGGLIDKTGKRKPFITVGYVLWGVTIMLFAAIPIDFSDDRSWGIITVLVVLDCVMTFFGSTANDAAFNTWVADVTDVSNRGKVNTILSVMPVIATVLVFGIGMFTYDSGATVTNELGEVIKVPIFERDPLNIKLFFIIMGIFPMIGGLLSFFMMKDAPGIVKNSNPNYLKETFYGFRPSVVKENKMMYVTLGTVCLLGIAQQIFMSYLINFIEKTLGITNYILPLAVIIVVGAVITGVLGVFFDKCGRKHFYYPLLAILVVGAIVVYCMKFMDSSAYLPILIVGGSVLLGAILSVSGALTASFQDYIPKGAEGRFQGVRMCFTVLIPMALGIGIAQAVGVNSLDAHSAGQMQPPFELFLAAAIVVACAAIPLFWVRKDSDRLRSELMNRKAAAEEDAAAEEQLPSESTAD